MEMDLVTLMSPSNIAQKILYSYFVKGLLSHDEWFMKCHCDGACFCLCQYIRSYAMKCKCDFYMWIDAKFRQIQSDFKSTSTKTVQNKRIRFEIKAPRISFALTTTWLLALAITIRFDETKRDKFKWEMND